MSITLRRSLRSASIALALLPILAIAVIAVAVIADAVIAAMPASAGRTVSLSGYAAERKKIGDLVPGLSALNDVVKMFPAAPQDYPGNPRPPAAFPEVKIGKVEPQPTTVYNPPETSYALFFDDNDKLVIIEDAHSPLAGLGPEAVHKRYPQAQGHRARRTGDRTPGPDRAVYRDDGAVQCTDAEGNQSRVRVHLPDQRLAKHSPRRNSYRFSPPPRLIRAAAARASWRSPSSHKLIFP